MKKTVLLVQLDGKLPSVALMRLAANYRERGWLVRFVSAPGPGAFDRGLWDADGREPDAVFGSLIFTWSQPLARRLLERFPHAVVGGTGWDLGKKDGRASLEALGVGIEQDYSLYPGFTASIGFTQRGCRLKCSFCDVPKSEGKVRAENTVNGLWRGGDHPKHLLLLDNDFFGQPDWKHLVSVMRAAEFRVCFSQGINARFLDDQAAEAAASLLYYDDAFKDRRIYTAWDSKPDEARLFAGLRRLVRYGVKPDEIMVYMLVGFQPGETDADRLYRHDKLVDFGCRPYPMPFRGVSGKPAADIQRFAKWAIRRYDRHVSWEEFKRARGDIYRVGRDRIQGELFDPSREAARPREVQATDAAGSSS